jgi:hypothetical protein
VSEASVPMTNDLLTHQGLEDALAAATVTQQSGMASLARTALHYMDRVADLEDELKARKYLGDQLAKRLKAKDALLVAYRVGGHRTPEKALDTLAKTEGVEAAWAALRAPSPTEGST